MPAAPGGPPGAEAPAGGRPLVALAFSGGLDTTVILAWLRERGWEVATVTADLGQGEGEVEEARARARALGVPEELIVVEDLRSEFVSDYVWPMLRADARYEGRYLLGTAIARPPTARLLARAARRLGASAVAHGATEKGNDQVRLELAVRSLEPGLEVVAPWREWDLRGRSDLVAWARARGVPLPPGCDGAEPPYSADANVLHVSAEGRALEDPWLEPPPEVWSRTVDPAEAPARGEEVVVGFEAGDAVSLDGAPLGPYELLEALNRVAGRNGVGRLDMVETRSTGMKSRGAYETPGGAALMEARRALEELTLDGAVARLRDDLSPRYASLVYDGLWFSPERMALQALFDRAQRPVRGEVRLRLARGSATAVARRSPLSLYDPEAAGFESGSEGGARGDAGGFIRVRARPLRLAAEQEERLRRGGAA